MNESTISVLTDIKDSLGKFIGYSVDSDGVVVDTRDCPFPFFDDEQPSKNEYYKVYNDGGHYVATRYYKGVGKRKEKVSLMEKVFDWHYWEAVKEQRKLARRAGKGREIDYDELVEYITPAMKRRFPMYSYVDGSKNIDRMRDLVENMVRRKKAALQPAARSDEPKATALDLAFDSLYSYNVQSGITGEALFESIKTGLLELFGDNENLAQYILDKLERKKRNLYARKKRFRRKGNLNKWNYFVTFTYDDKKHTPESFRKKLRKCLSNLHTRRGWRYMGAFEEAPETGRLHFHGVFYIPDGELVGAVTTAHEYSKRLGKMQETHPNSFFTERFGKNDFDGIDEMSIKHGNTLEYILKYISKTGERIIYSRGIPSEICVQIEDTDIIGEMQDFMTKFVLFDNAIEWERDIMHYTKLRQMKIIEIICNPPQYGLAS